MRRRFSQLGVPARRRDVEGIDLFGPFVWKGGLIPIRENPKIKSSSSLAPLRGWGGAQGEGCGGSTDASLSEVAGRKLEGSAAPQRQE